MQPEVTLETLFKDIADLKTLAAGIKVGQEEDEKKKLEAKKAMEEKKEEEKMEAKKAKYNSAIKAAMEEDDHDKKEALVKHAMDELHDKEHKGMDEEHNKHKKEAMEEEKEKDAQVASIINDKKNSLIAQILTANRIINPNGLQLIETRLKKASITEVQKEYDIVKPFISGVESTPVPPTQPVIPYFANITPADVDANQLNASSPDSDFTKLSTKELLEGNQ